MPSLEIELRPARAEDQEALRQFMPYALQVPHPKAFWVVQHRASGTIVGGWMIYWRQTQDWQAGFYWRLVDSLMESPVTELMMHRLLQTAREMGARHLVRDRLVAEKSPDAVFLQRSGFVPIDATLWFMAELETFDARIHASWERIRRRSDVEKKWQIGPLSEKFFPAMTRLIQKHRLVTEDEWRVRLQEGPFGYSRELSQMVYRGEALAGMLLISVGEPGVAEVDVRVVDKSEDCDAATANVWMMHEGLRRFREMGGRQFRFRAHSGDHRETENLARRSGARALPRQFLFARSLV